VTAFLVALAGALGASSRYLVERRLRTTSWPRGTFAVNVSGCLALGLLLGLALPEPVATTLGVGFVGAYTTFSAYAVEIVAAPRRVGLAYAAGSVVAGVLAAGLGLWLGGHL